ncbi:SusD/RagB family nutrient-binding outer membrane lipoprotein [Niabella beijingensis]|uniref:SusD/RagB family nutrient-binding outer membrane lipoprotein n=1 Tax=Niabella beijingensis TaxID=2872700 RepID=UPI001CBCA46B|nr:SusD/RagB family nutrient-binding outer membrane lipoprotein [Niabella beijingensis]MBZ4188690.1 SusD/RagB family nutrient-binding outer membrane lipoprotein [Niabella beijingensis]
MKYISYIYIAALIIAFASCKKFEYFQTNPNNPVLADPALLLTNIELSSFATISPSASLSSRHLVYTQGASGAQYYDWTRADMSYPNIAQVVRMEQEAARVGKLNYRYIGKFFRAYYVINMTQRFGDIPYSQMMRSITDNNFTDSAVIRPVYDKQRDIYLGVLNDLKIASDSLSANGIEIGGDLIYNGDITKWKKLINSFALRVLMSLSRKEADAGLDIKQRFNEIVSNSSKYPLFGSNTDNGQLKYYDITGNRYPYYNDNSMKTDYYLDSSFVRILKQLKDPRLFVYGQPLTTSLAIREFDSYDGLVGSAPLAYNTAKKGQGKASQINRRFAYEAVNEPSVLMAYSEVQFLLAEGAVRGWISGNADEYYENGIKAAMQFSNFNYPSIPGVTYVGQQYTDAEIENYLKQTVIGLKAGTEIEQIITQKYISMFMNTGLQPFYENRRTGFPLFEVKGAGIVNKVNGSNAVPKRWMYPLDEVNNNGANLQNAIKSQYPDGDNINGIMWLIQ